jgi:H-type small acid-soluble spore protein
MIMVETVHWIEYERGWRGLNIERAQEIFDSLGVIEVLHHGAPVWLEEVANDLATVKCLPTLTVGLMKPLILSHS